MPKIELFAFRYFDECRGRWMRSRYKASREVIATRYPHFELLSDPEVREVPDDPLLLTASRILRNRS